MPATPDTSSLQLLRPDALPRTDGLLYALMLRDPDIVPQFVDKGFASGPVGPYVTHAQYRRLCELAKPQMSADDWARVERHMPVEA